MFNGDAALQARFDSTIEEEFQKGEQVIVNTIAEVGIKRRTGYLLNSVRYLGQIEPGTFRYVLEAPYASYLNRGYGPFSMIDSRLGKVIPMRDANGRLIFRRVSMNPTKTNKNWMHPGWEETNFVEIAKEKIQQSIVTRVQEFLTELEPEL